MLNFTCAFMALFQFKTLFVCRRGNKTVNTDHLRYFQKLAETGHFSKAAKELCITQPALSNSIRKLEKSLGFTLFESSDEANRSVKLTVYGAEFARHINVALKEIDKAMNVAGPRALENTPLIRLGSVASVRRTFLPKLLSSFVTDHGSIVNFDLVEGRSTFSCTKAVLEGELDMAICGQLPDEEKLGFIPMLFQNAAVVVNPKMPLASQKSVSLTDLKNYPVISYRDRAFTYYPFKELSDQYGFKYYQAFEDEVNGAVQVLADMRLVAFLLDTIESDIRSKVTVLPVAELEEPFHAVGLVYRKDKDFSPAEEAFLEYVRRRARDLEHIVPLESGHLTEYEQED